LLRKKLGDVPLNFQRACPLTYAIFVKPVGEKTANMDTRRKKRKHRSGMKENFKILDTNNSKKETKEWEREWAEYMAWGEE
jgi:hypothetical protein